MTNMTSFVLDCIENKAMYIECDFIFCEDYLIDCDSCQLTDGKFKLCLKMQNMNTLLETLKENNPELFL